MGKWKYESLGDGLELDELPLEESDPSAARQQRDGMDQKSLSEHRTAIDPRASAPHLGNTRVMSVPPLRSSSSKNSSAKTTKTRSSLAKPAGDNGSMSGNAERKPDSGPAAKISRTIQDLEGLLNEALQMAKVAAGGQEDDKPGASQVDVSTRQPERRAIIRRSTRSSSLRGSKMPTKVVKASLTTRPRPLAAGTRARDFAKQSDGKDHAHDFPLACDSHPPQADQFLSSLAAPLVSCEEAQGTMKSFPDSSKASSTSVQNREPPRLSVVSISNKDTQEHLSRPRNGKGELPTRRTVKGHIKAHKAPAVMPRTTSRRTRIPGRRARFEAQNPEAGLTSSSEVDDEDIESLKSESDGQSYQPNLGHEGHFSQIFGVPCPSTSQQAKKDAERGLPKRKVDLRGCRHVDVHRADEFDIYDTYTHQPVARDWPNSRKRFAAFVACINTAVLGMIIGIYAGEVPAIQYVIVDFHHYAILGNVCLYVGLIIPTLVLWPLPLLHGRKPYTIFGLAIALCLQIPQGVAVGAFRSPYVGTYRRILLISRALSGFAFGFANINLQAGLLDVFGASLQSGNPHNEVLNQYDARRHGGGIGVWLGIFSWCSIGSISVGFFVGALIIKDSDVTWGFWTSLLLLLLVLLLNVVAPELRRSAFRRTIAEIKDQGGDFSRVAKGEVKMHVKGTGPYWWGEEVKAGVELCYLMLKQPGFAILSLYTAWAYAHFLVILILLGALTSRYYRFGPVLVGLCVFSMAIGALLATPFQKASFFSRARHHPQRTDSATFEKRVVWSSHLARRLLFMILLPLSAIAYTFTSKGPPMDATVPALFAGLVGFFSNLALAECYALMMETFDTSDLQPGMIGRPRQSLAWVFQGQRTNFSCYPRVSAAFAITQSLQFVLAAIATGICGRVERRYGAMQTAGIAGGVLLVLTLLLTIVLVRFKTVQMIPDRESRQMRKLVKRDTNWRPVIIGNPSGLTRKISILEAGRQSRWSEIRSRNRLDAGLTGSFS